MVAAAWLAARYGALDFAGGTVVRILTPQSPGWWGLI